MRVDATHVGAVAGVVGLERPGDGDHGRRLGAAPARDADLRAADVELRVLGQYLTEATSPSPTNLPVAERRGCGCPAVGFEGGTRRPRYTWGCFACRNLP